MVNGQTMLSVVQNERKVPPLQDEMIWRRQDGTGTNPPRLPTVTVWCLTWTAVVVPAARNAVGVGIMIGVAAQDLGLQCTLRVMMTRETRTEVGQDDTAAAAESTELVEMGGTRSTALVSVVSPLSVTRRVTIRQLLSL